MVLGISADTLADQQKFTQKENLNFPLLADTEKKVAKAYGVPLLRGQYPSRMTFVIDSKGTLRKVYPKVNAREHPEEVLEYIEKNLTGK